MFEFKKATPIFLKGKNRVLNLQAGFQTVFNGEIGTEYRLNITGSTLYRVYLNGEVIHYGPARAPHGYIRCDSVTFTAKTRKNIISIEVAGYNCPSFYTMDIPSFLQAEIMLDNDVISYTGKDFRGIDLSVIREQKTLRYSYQRAFTEVWNMNKLDYDWKNTEFDGEEIERVEIGHKLIARGFKLPFMEIYSEVFPIESGKISNKGKYAGEEKRFTKISNEVVGFKREECPDKILDDLNINYIPNSNYKKNIKENEYSLYKLGRNSTGFIRLSLNVKKTSVVYLAFDEKLTDGAVECGVDTKNLLNIVKYTLNPSDKPVDLETFECYTFQYLSVIVLSGEVEVDNVELRQYVYPATPIKNPFNDRPIISKVLDAAFETFRQNTIDCFMDCPGRERAGWLCDSYFTAFASFDFTGTLECEKLFLENFTMPENFAPLPRGLLPMCYPGENVGRGAIPQWAMWYVVEIGSYVERGGDASVFEKLVTDLLWFLKCFENSDGLLENLPYWNFVEFSKANSLTSGVNYPTNMLYHKVLEVAYRLYPQLAVDGKLEKIRTAIIEQSFDGEFFRDHAIRDEGEKLVVMPDKTAICQHEAFFFDVVSVNDEKFANLRKFIIENCGYGGNTGELEPLGMFMGYNIRIFLLNKFKEFERNLKEIEQMYGMMADISGTLWEHLDTFGGGSSRNHGLSAAVADAILECAKGLKTEN